MRCDSRPIRQNAVSSRPSTENRFTCICCGYADATLFLRNCRDLYMSKPGSFDYYQCGNCSLVQLHPIPPDIGVFYGAYGVHAKKSRLHDALRNVLMRRGYYFPSPQRGKLRIIDFGSGDGWYIREMKQLGHDVVGFETDPQHADMLSKTLQSTVYSNVAMLREAHRGKADLLTMHFVLEHVTDLTGTIELASDLLAPGGLLHVVVPNLGSIEFRLFRRKWHGLDPPRHISFPGSDAIESLGAKHGLATEVVETFGLPNDVAGSLSNVILGHFHPIAFAASIPLAILWSPFAQGDIRVLLRKCG